MFYSHEPLWYMELRLRLVKNNVLVYWVSFLKAPITKTDFGDLRELSHITVY